MLRLPDRRFFRRRGEGAFEMYGFEGQTFDDPGAPSVRWVSEVSTGASGEAPKLHP
jgi:hypothetical protein